MDLRKRLARLDRLSRRPADGPRTGGPARTAFDPAAALPALGLAPAVTPAGEVWQRHDVRADVPEPAGEIPDLRGILPAPAPAGLCWSDILFLDTETTGLAGGTGTLPFLVGLAWWEEGVFQVRQLFLPAPGREEPLLAEIARVAGGFRAVATYNGAGFDLPLLRTRARLARRPDPFAETIGWDLLVGARRCWGRRLPDCRQQTVEARVCGRRRGPGDIAGALIPAVYQRFLYDGDTGDLPAVLRHNRRDMDGLARVMGALAAEARVLATPTADAVDAHAAWSRALACERRRETGLAAAWARILLRPGVLAGVDAAAVRDAIRLLKRTADWSAVEALVATGLDRWPREPRLHYEAAVLFEHRLRDPHRALPHARILGDARRVARLQARVEGSGGCPTRRSAL